MNRQTKCKVNGVNWAVKVVTAKEMKKAVGEKGLAGIAVHADKTIYLDEDNVTYEVIAHELHHAYYFDLHLDDTEGIPMADIREIFADLFADKGARMVSQAKRIYKDLKAE